MEMRRVLIISPYFAPTNAADMQRIRMSLPWFKDLGWEAEVVTVDLQYSDLGTDTLLSECIANETIIHRVKAFPKTVTSKFGLGSIALRSIWFYRRKVNALLILKKYDLLYFSTTQFPVCILGAYWKKHFGIPYIIDMQDPWHSEYYRDKPKAERPAKYWFSYRLNKWLEPIAMKQAAGLISVSQAYLYDLKKRYPQIKDIPEDVIPFGVSDKDFKIAENNKSTLTSLVEPEAGKINIVYVGRGGHDMQTSVTLLCKGLLKGISRQPEIFEKFHLHFIGTSYASAGQGLKTIQPLADELGLKEYVTECTDRISFYNSIATLQAADVLFIPGSDDPKYTASKLFPYLMSRKPILAIFHEKSSAVDILRSCSPASQVFTFPAIEDELVQNIYHTLLSWATSSLEPLILNQEVFKNYSAEVMAAKQVALFEQVLVAQRISSR